MADLRVKHSSQYARVHQLPAETRYSTFDGELLAVYLAIRHFRHFLKGRDFHVLTDHKLLTHALHTRSDRHSPRQARQLDYISQFTSNIRHIHGSDNVFIFLEKKEMGCQVPAVYCCRTAPTAMSDASVTRQVGASDLG